MKQIVFKLVLAATIGLGFCAIGAALAGDLTQEAKNEQVMNARRENRILTAFNLDPGLHAYDLTVIVDGSRAALGGTVKTALARALAAQVASRSNGIEHVDNRIRVDAGAVSPGRDSAELKGG